MNGARRLEHLSRVLEPESNELASWLIHDNIALRQKILQFLGQDDLFLPNYYQGLMEFRSQTLERLQRYAAQRFFKTIDYLKDPRRFMAGLECLAFVDYSLAIKAGVHFTLCGGTICKLGTERHHEQYLDAMDDLRLPGCFGMSELGHGSNVMGIETTAVYDAQAQEFIINTPSNEASKYWIGGAAQHGKVCTVFAQLTVNGTWQGPHVFVVRIRDDFGNVSPGVRIEDNGPKMGLNGVDNGRLWFTNVRVPRTSLLNKFADVSPDGKYSSPVPSVSSRFGVMVGGLTTGRMLIAQSALDSLKIGLSIAIRYSLQRPQFNGKLIMHYITHQRRLIPALAQAYALQIAMGQLKRVAFDGQGTESMSAAERAKYIHVTSAGLKAAATWIKTHGLQQCRECCGGQGFLAVNKIGPMMTSTNVDTTFEGDNTVMMQQVAKAMVDEKSDVSAPPAKNAVQEMSPETVQRFLHFRLTKLASILRGSMQKAAAAAPRNKAAAAAGEEFERNGDIALQLGWAKMHAYMFENFLGAIPSAPVSSQPALKGLVRMFGLHCITEESSFYYSHGVLPVGSDESLRQMTGQVMDELMANNGMALLQLCNGFGIPDHCLQAPIAFDWRSI